MQGPPQSMPVSSWFWMPSLHVGPPPLELPLLLELELLLLLEPLLTELTPLLELLLGPEPPPPIEPSTTHKLPCCTVPAPHITPSFSSSFALVAWTQPAASHAVIKPPATSPPAFAAPMSQLLLSFIGCTIARFPV